MRNSTAQIATTQPHAGTVAPHLQTPEARDAEHAVELTLWSHTEGLARIGREACERGERVRVRRSIQLLRARLADLEAYAS